MGFMRKTLCWPSFALVGAVLVMTACGREESASSLQALEQPRPLVVVMGGNTSCQQGSPLGMGLHAKGVAYAAQIRQQYGMEPRYMVTCHTSSSDVYYVTHEAPRETQHVSLGGFTSVLRAFIEPDAPLIMIGHSYGGWLAMKMAQAMPDVHVTQLATIDPISRKTCAFTRPFGCQSAPQDISRGERLAIKAHTGVWNNFYQTVDFYLHSSAMAEADRNDKLATGHTSIDTAGYVWDTIWQSSHFPNRPTLASH